MTKLPNFRKFFGDLHVKNGPVTTLTSVQSQEPTSQLCSSVD